MNPKLSIIQRQLGIGPKQEKAPAPDTSGLGAAIQQLIDQAVKQQVQQVEAALEQQREQHSPRVRRLMEEFNAPPMHTDYRQLPPPPKTAPAKNLKVQLMRDAAFVTRWVQIGDLKFEIERDGAGRAVGMKQVNESPVLPQPDIPFKAEAREYNPGESR